MLLLLRYVMWPLGNLAAAAAVVIATVVVYYYCFKRAHTHTFFSLVLALFKLTLLAVLPGMESAKWKTD